ncbi:MFS transporter [Brachybacterium sp. AOP29-B2-41]|uniref:MFS transporter n=1 Tax=Brachybacterium sp. AOP29-B2-41 TaxID=3457704 RepID=UPI00403331B5
MRRILQLAVMQCAALGALTAPAVVAVSVLVRRMVGDDSAPGVYALIDAAAALTAMIAAPLCGLLADRTMSRLGRRRPWLLGGSIVGLLGSAAMAWAPGPLALAAAWMLTQAGYNAVFAAINGLLAEGLAPTDRTRAAGIFSAAAFLGTAPGLLVAALLAENVRAMLLVVPVAALAVIVPLALRIPDPPLTARLPAARRTPRRRLRAAAASGVSSAPFLAVLAMRFLFSLQLSAGLAFALYLFISRWSLAEGAAVRATSLTTFTGVVGVVAGSMLLTSSRWRSIRMTPVLGVALMLLAAAMLGRALAPTLLVFHVATAVAGLAIGLGMTATRSLAYALLPAASAGFGLGLVGAAGSLAGLIAPLAAAALLTLSTSWGSADPYIGMYTLLALPALLGLALLPLTRVPSASQPSPAEVVPP